jgi:Xaa-Pro aminopeptidase
MSYGKLAVDWEERINFDRMRKERLEKAQRAMKKHNLEVMLILSGVNHRYIAQNVGNVRNIPATGLRYVFLPQKGVPVLFEHGMWYPYVKQHVPWLNVKCAVGLGGSGGAAIAGVFRADAFNMQLKKFADQIKEEMKAHGLTGEVLGVDAYVEPLIKALNDAGIKHSMEGHAALIEARTIKTRDEIECLRMAASIVEGAWAKCKENLKPGITELELRAIFHYEVLRQGGLPYATGEITSGPRTFCNSLMPDDRAIRPGDLVIMHGCNTQYMGYSTCYYLTFVCGKPTRAMIDAYKIARDYLYDAIKIMKPGTTTKELAEKWPRAEEFGYSDEDMAHWIQFGHGIGLTLAEPPTVTRLISLDYPEKLEAGMTLGMETWWPIDGKLTPGGQSVRIEEMVAVTETGYEVLSQWPIDELTVCAF